VPLGKDDNGITYTRASWCTLFTFAFTFVRCCRINTVFHDNPNILHYRNYERMGVMSEGHTFTIEPMICAGSARVLRWPDQWTATTSDGSRSAQFEHTLVVTRDGVEALTAKLPSSPKYAWER
jgi:methionyl aminopeptidase